MKQSNLIKLSAVGASAFALGGYVNQSLFNQQREREAQTAKEEANIRIRQLEEQLAAAEAEKSLQTAVDFYNHTATLNNKHLKKSSQKRKKGAWNLLQFYAKVSKDKYENF